MNVNSVTIAGRLTKDAELKALPSGSNVCNFSLATSEYYEKDGEKQESTEFHNIVVFGRQAENCAKYLAKGQLALVQGKLQTRSWEKDGVKHYRTEVVAMIVQFGPKSSGEANSEPHSAPDSEDIDAESVPF